MSFILVFAFLSGILTILSPCILPVLPVILAGGVGGGRARPFGIIAGFVLGFTFFTLALSALVQELGISADALRFVAVAVIALFGLVMVVPALGAAFERATSRIASMGSKRRSASSPGFLGGIPVGLSLGLVWTPCVGPIMASVVSLAVTRRVDGGAVLIAIAYSLGTALPMLAVMLGGRALVSKVPAFARNSPSIRRGFGVLMIVVALSIGFGLDRRFQTAVLALFPDYGSGLTALENAAPLRAALADRDSLLEPGNAAAVVAAPVPETTVFSGVPDSSKDGKLGDFGPAPPLVATGAWFGGPPLSMEGLRGKVVLVDFWTYSCVNCVRTLPSIKAWYGKYRDSGLVVIGVHTPEFEFEKSAANLGKAIRDLGITWPVVQDNDFAQWTAYRNRYWPAHYFIDARGIVRYVHYGEGAYAESERVIRQLLDEAKARLPEASVPSKAEGPDAASGEGPAGLTAETYLGYSRARGFVSAVPPAADAVVAYRPSREPGQGEWSLAGRWTIADDYVVPEGSGVLELGFTAKDVFLVVEPMEPGGSISVSEGGSRLRDTEDMRDGVLRPSESRLYRLAGFESRETGILRLEVKGRLRLFAFTFG